MKSDNMRITLKAVFEIPLVNKSSRNSALLLQKADRTQICYLSLIVLLPVQLQCDYHPASLALV